ncbi:MAG: NAD(P)-dependent oxidoreductase [Candidatus Riflebacteria bacterium]|nr:NAD(P)-dependent oxidoreductase [Candidatus Riflebacteria bacterium]
MKKIIVAGGGGFVGRQALKPLIEAGFEVHAVDLNPLKGDFSEIHWHNVDLYDFAALKELFAELRPTHLLNFAWFTRHGEYWSSPENFKSLTANFKILELFAECGGKRIVMAGTCAEYEWNTGACIEGITKLEPKTVYGSCKLAMYELLKSFARVNGLSWAWGRIFFVFGPFENPRRFVPAVVLPLLQSRPATCSHGNQIRDFLSTKDVGSAFATLVAGEVQGAINIASGRPLSLKQIVGIIESATTSYNMVKFGELTNVPEDPPIIIAATERLRREVGWMPTVALEERLAETIDWWKNNLV